MKKTFLLLALFITTHSFAESFGTKAKIQLKVFEGSNIMMYERNLSQIQNCVVAIRNNSEKMGNCTIELSSIDRTKKTGIFYITLNGINGNSSEFIFSALANGYVGGGQDGPYFTTRSTLDTKSSQFFIMNLGFFSKTPELAQDYLVRIDLLDLKTCSSIDDCSKF